VTTSRAAPVYILGMLEKIHFEKFERRSIYLALSAAVAVGVIFFSLSAGSASTGVLPATPTSKLSLSQSPFPVPPELPATIVVDVAGKVLHPGIYTLTQGARAADAIKLAGGALKGVALTDINLAQVLTDGQQIIVGAPVVVSTSSKSKSSKAASGKITSGTIDINTANTTEFERLPGIGAVMAARIVAYRASHGNFSTISDLSKVSGMGKSKYTNLVAFVRV